MTVELLFQFRQLFLYRPHLRQSLPGADRFRENLPAQLQLLFKIARSRGGSRIHYDLQRLSERFSVDSEARLISSRNRARPARRSIIVSSRLNRRLVARIAPRKIPYKTMHARTGLQNLRCREPALSDGPRRMLRFRIDGRKCLNHSLVRIKNLELDVPRSGVEVVINDRAIRRIVRGRLFRRQRSRDEVIVIDAHGCGWLVEVWATRLHNVTRLPQRRDVIENPKRATVGGDNQVISVNYEVVNRSDR